MIKYTSQRNSALTAGFSLIVMALFAAFAYGYAFTALYDPLNAEVTLHKLDASPGLFRGMIFSFVLILILDVIAGWALYFFFGHGQHRASWLMTCLRMVYAALLGVALQSLLSVLTMLDDTFRNEMMIMHGFKTFLGVWTMALIVFGFHLLVLGWIMLRDKRMPKVFGVMMMIAAVAYIFSNSADLLLEEYHTHKATIEMVLSLPMAAGELGLAEWLIFRGGKQKPKTLS